MPVPLHIYLRVSLVHYYGKIRLLPGFRQGVSFAESGPQKQCFLYQPIGFINISESLIVNNEMKN